MGTGRKSIITLVFVFFGIAGIFPKLAGQKVRIGLFEDQVISTLVFNCTGGSFEVFGDSALSREINSGELVYISLMGGKLLITDEDFNFQSFDKIEFKDRDENSGFRLKIVDPLEDPRNYKGKLEINLFHGTVQLVNELPFNEYLEGVVETETGPAASSEFYKAQAILCRSYTIKNWGKHPGQEFNLCDNTHCQAFHGISYESPAIHEAVLATHGLVLTNLNYSIVSAIFHSNSGGETQRASDIWNGSEDYLQAVMDPFSEGQRNASWEKTIKKDYWKQYIARHSRENITKIPEDQVLIRQDHRKKYFVVGKDSLLIADIRNDLNLRSTFFSMEFKNDDILIHGRGYGHGVGMSQEGAMEMARQGYSYSDILRFYFYNVQIVELSDVPDSELPEVFR